MKISTAIITKNTIIGVLGTTVFAKSPYYSVAIGSAAPMLKGDIVSVRSFTMTEDPMTLVGMKGIYLPIWISLNRSTFA